MGLPYVQTYVNPVGASIERWLASHPPRTAETYRESLELAVRVIREHREREPSTLHSIDWSTFRDDHLSMLREAMARRYSAATINRTLAAIRSLAQRLRRDRLIDADQLAAMNAVRGMPRTHVRPRVALSTHEQRLLFNACELMRAPNFHRALLGLMLGGGLRSAEAIDFINEREPMKHLVFVTTESDDVIGLDVMGKGRKGRRVYLRGRARTAVALFASFTDGDDRHGFYTPLTTAILVARCRDLARKARVRNFTPHDLRRTFASNMLRRTDIVLVQKMMGHADPKQTAQYDVRVEETMVVASYDPWE